MFILGRTLTNINHFNFHFGIFICAVDFCVILVKELRQILRNLAS